MDENNRPQGPVDEPVTQSTDSVPVVAEILPPERVYRPGQFQPGHARMGGRKPGSVSQRTKLAREVAGALKYDGVRIAIEVITTGFMKMKDPVTGELTYQLVPVEERLKAHRDLQQYLQPKLSSIQVTGKDDGPIRTAHLDIVELLRDPKLAEAAQMLAFTIAERPAEIEGDTDDDSPDEQAGD